MLVVGLAGGGYWYWTHRASATDAEAVASAANTSSSHAPASTATASPAATPTSTTSGSAASPAQDATATAPDIGSIAVKDIAFDQYKADVYAGSTVLPDFDGAQKQYREYRTRITEGAKLGVNFAGHYALVTFGCGSGGCLTGYVVDETNGGVSELGFGGETQMYLNIDAKPGSNLLKASYYDGKACRLEAAVWDGTHFKTIARQSSAPAADDSFGSDCPQIGDTATSAVASAEGDASAAQAAEQTPAQQQPTTPATSLSPSFDCTKARSYSETTICNDPELARLDIELAGIYRQAKARATDKAAFRRQTEAAWQWRETNCHDRQCLVDWYTQRKAALEQGMGGQAP
ncbi:MAG: hypothetical protein JSS44_09385 [Proteobacteria bacterium]|nr:hypothetical protein [Pseudomonadota bacterium]